MKKNTYILAGLLCIVVFVAIMLVRTRLYKGETFIEGRNSIEREQQAARSGTVILHYHDRKPYYFKGPEGVSGLCAKPAAAVFKEAGIPFRWQETPAKRQLDMIKANNRMECAVGWFKNPEREKFAKYTLPIYQDKPTVALARADNDRVLSRISIEQMFTDRGLRLLRKDGYSYGPFIDASITTYQPREVVTTADNFSMLKMIHSLRADYFFIAEEEAGQLITESSFSPSDFKYIHFSDMPEGNKRYIICSPKLPDELIERLNQSIREYGVTTGNHK